MDKEADLQGSVGLRISKKGPPFLVEAVDVVIDEQGCLQGHRAYKNAIVNVHDRLVAVDGCTAETMERLAPGSIQTALKGPRGSIVELAFISAVTGSVFSIRVARHMVKEVVSEIMSTEALKDAAGIRQKEAPCGIGVIIGRHDFHDDTQPCYILKLSAGGSALQSGEIDVGDVRHAHVALPAFHPLISSCLSVSPPLLFLISGCLFVLPGRRCWPWVGCSASGKHFPRFQAELLDHKEPQWN
jgi:hypothetical protein